jgi:phosphopantothenoylcysteine decarboxylase/phosphopantothenate--cysteine ligase
VASGAHIESAREADLIIIAPATADFIARVAQGRSDDLLSATVLTAQAPLVIVPAMHHQMWRNPATVENVKTLRARGIYVMEPAEGPLNNGDSGVGRFPEVFEIFEYLREIGALKSDLLGKEIVVTAGGTREMIDPVRFIGNLSSGKQGIALAKAAAARGAKVKLIGANIEKSLLPQDKSIDVISVSSAQELASEMEQIRSFDLLFMTAAVADYRPATMATSKIKRDGSEWVLNMVENPDLLAGFTSRGQLNQRGIVIGFAAESEINLALAEEKLARKRVEFLFVNDISGQEVFGSDSNGGILINVNGTRHTFDYQSKDTLSHALLDVLSKALS